MNLVAAVPNVGTPWLTVAGAIPLLGAIVVMLLPVRFAKLTALLFTVVDLIWVIVMAAQFNTSGPTYQFTEQYSWIPQFGVHYALGVDGIALVLIGMTVVLMPVVFLASWHDADNVGKSPKMYFALMLVLETMMIGVFAATIGGSSGRLRRLQNGFVRSYALSMLIGAVLLLAGLLVVRL